MKRNLLFCILTLIFLMPFVQVSAQEAASETIENKHGRITLFYTDSESSSIIFFNAFREMYKNDDEYYVYRLIDPTEVEELFFYIFSALYDDFIECYYDPEEENTVIMGPLDKDKITEFQIYILSVGCKIGQHDVNFIYIQNTVNGEQALFCNIENY